MSLHRKTLIITGLTIGCLTLVLYFIAQLILLNSFSKLEEREVHKNIERVLYSFNDDIAALHRYANDWAAWDDTYAFINGEDKKYTKSNLVDSTFVTLKLNLVMFINSSGNLVYAKAFDLQKEESVPIPKSIQEHLVSQSLLLNHTNLSSNLSGIIFLKEGPMLISSWPIRTSDEKGPIRGTLIFGRYFDSTEIERIAKKNNLSLTFSVIDEKHLSKNYLEVYSSLSDNSPILIKSLSSKKIGGYTLLKDIYGKPILLLSIDMPRDIYQQGKTSLYYFVLFLIFTGLVFAALTYLFLANQILSRIFNLISSIRNIHEKRDFSLRVSVKGNDELSSLSNEINKMLATQEHSEKVLKASSLSDELTGLYNRRGFISLAEQQLKIAERMKREMILLYGDLDNLKSINDRLGHLEGDRALIDTTKILKETFRESDIIARIGGDEFAVLTEIKEDISTEVLTLRLQKNINAYNEQEGRFFKISLSIGIASYDPKNPRAIEKLMVEADTHMYKQKREKQEQ